IARRARVAGDRLARGRNRLTLAERAAERRDAQRETGRDDRPGVHCAARRRTGTLRVQRREGPREDHECDCHETTFTHHVPPLVSQKETYADAGACTPDGAWCP